MEETLVKVKKEMLEVAKIIQGDDLKIKQALCFDKQIDYFRGKWQQWWNWITRICFIGDNFHEVVKKNEEKILKCFKEIKAFRALQTIDEQMRLIILFIQLKLIVPLDRNPGFPDDFNKKYPKHLNPPSADNLRLTAKGFYMWNIDRPRGKLALLLGIGIVIVIAFMMFNLWPLWLKIALWYFSFYTLVFLVSIIISFKVLSLNRWV